MEFRLTRKIFEEKLSSSILLKKEEKKKKIKKKSAKIFSGGISVLTCFRMVMGDFNFMAFRASTGDAGMAIVYSMSHLIT
jgi:hypothetical protein